MFGLDRLEGKALYKVMSAACGVSIERCYRVHVPCYVETYANAIHHSCSLHSCKCCAILTSPISYNIRNIVTKPSLTRYDRLYGWDAGVLGGIQATPQFLNAIRNPTGAFIIPIIASVYNLAAGVMSLCVTFFGMQLGRRGTILLGTALICCGALLQASTYSVAQIIVGRIVTGCGIGCIASAVPTYMAEMSLEAKQRGPEISYQLALLITGVAMAYWVDLGFVQGLPSHPYLWRIPLALQSCFAIFSATLLMFLPDTPRWYYARGRYQEADKVLARLHALPIEHENVQMQREEVLASLKEENDTESFNFWLLFWDNSDLQFGRRLRTSFLILWAQQFLGINMLVRSLMGRTLPLCLTHSLTFCPSALRSISVPKSS